MTSNDFAAAQQRVLARRQLREAQRSTRIDALQSRQASHRLAQLPYGIGRVARTAIETWDIVKGREGTRPAFRVGQVDAELLDEELLQLLKGQVGDGLKYFGAHLSDDWGAEIQFLLRAALFKLSIWDHDASYGATLQGLKYTDARHKGAILKSPTVWQKAVYGVVTVGGRYVWKRWEDWLIDQEGGYEEPSARVRMLSRVSGMLATTHSVAAFASFLVFLVNGRYRTLLDRVLRMRLAPPSSQVSREVSFEYLNRQLVWHAFTEFLLFLLPLVGIGRWRRWLSRAWRKTKSMVRNEGEEVNEDEHTGELAFLPERTCAICYQSQNPTSTSESELVAVTSVAGGVIGSAQTDITNPYECIPCGCVYCFVCLATKIEAEEGEGWVCLRCGELVKECKPWSGDVLEEISRPSSGKSVTFSDDENIVKVEVSETEMDEDEDVFRDEKTGLVERP